MRDQTAGHASRPATIAYSCELVQPRAGFLKFENRCRHTCATRHFPHSHHLIINVRVSFKSSNTFPTRHFPHSHRGITATADSSAITAPRHRSHIRGVPSRVWMHSPLDTSHTLTVLSSLPLQIRVPSLLHDTAVTSRECPSRVRMHSPLDTSHTFTVASSLPLQIRVPSLLHDTQSHEQSVLPGY